MIYLTRLNRSGLVLNSDLIEQIEATPDTVITLTSGRNYMVLETPAEVISRSIEYRRQILNGHDCPAVKSSLPFGHNRGALRVADENGL